MKRFDFIGFFCFIFLFCISFESNAQFSPNHNISFEQLCIDVLNNNVIMSISYEPSAEDFATLAYYRFKYGVKIYSVFLTRGESGENFLSSDLYQKLGAIRSAEEREAARIIDSDPYYCNFFDNGISRNKNEIIAGWGGKDTILSRLAFFIRKLKPDIIIFGSLIKNDLVSRNSLLSEIIPEAVKKASEKNSYSYQLSSFFMPWKVKRIFNLTDEKNNKSCIIIPVKESNKLLGTTYLDYGKKALESFKSLGSDVQYLVSDEDRYYKLISAGQLNNQENDGLITDLKNQPEGIKEIDDFLKDVMKYINNKEKALEGFYKIDMALDQLKNQLSSKSFYDPLKDRIATSLKFKIADLKTRLIGIKVHASVSETAVCQRQVLLLKIDSIENLPKGETRVYFLNINPDWAIIRGTDYLNNFILKFHEPFQIVTPENIPLTSPEHEYQYSRFTNDPPLRYVIIHKSTDLRYNFQYFDEIKFDIVPKAVLNVEPEIVYLGKKHSFDYNLIHYLNDPYNNVSVKLSNTELGKSISDTFNLTAKYQKKTGKIDFIPRDSLKKGIHNLFFTVGKPIYSRVITKKFDCQVDPSIKIGLIKNNNSPIEKFLIDLDINYMIIKPEEIKNCNLDIYSTILIDVLVCNLYPDLFKDNKILNYIERGGNLLIMNQEKSLLFNEYEFNSLPSKFVISKNSVFNEKSGVIVHDNQHPFLNYPNKIKTDDWKKWFIERGRNFPMGYTKDFKEIISMGDQGEPFMKSGIIQANYGKGTITYTCLSLDRQIYSVVEGAYRLFANMISLKRN